MSNSDLSTTVIIKRKRIVAADGHHGGAWKVAYADFVTAMMAFFLLMWLLSATTEEQRLGLADYFTPTITVNNSMSGGDGALGGTSVLTEEIVAQDGTGASDNYAAQADQAMGDTGLSPLDGANSVNDAADISIMEDILQATAGESAFADDLLQHIHTKITDEGLIIDLFDLDTARLFDVASNRPTPLMHALLKVVSDVSALVSNDIAISGHAHAEGGGKAFRSGWELSAMRANASRQAIQNYGVSSGRFRRITGEADRAQVTDNILDSRNRRVVVTILRSDLPN